MTPATSSAGPPIAGSRPQRLKGVVVAAKTMTKTVVVSVERLVLHQKLRKQFRRTKRFLVHDEREEAQEGDTVLIEQTSPHSRHKHFRLVTRLTSAKRPPAEPDAVAGDES